jgi:hypothetical protein
LHDSNFERSVAEAQATAQLVPYDSQSLASLTFYPARAAKLDKAIEWASWSVNRSRESLGYQILPGLTT